MDGWCLYSIACPRRATGWPDPTHSMCDRHRVRDQKRQAKAKRDRRSALSDAGKCVRCRKPSTTYRCPACRLKDQTTLPSKSVQAGVSAAPDQWRRDSDGWERFRGKGTRGGPKQSAMDDADLVKAQQSLERGRNSLVYANSAPVRAVSREAQRDAKAAAASILLMAAGFIRDVAVRNLPQDPAAATQRGRVREALGDGVDPEMLDDAMIDRVIAAVLNRPT